MRPFVSPKHYGKSIQPNGSRRLRAVISMALAATVWTGGLELLNYPVAPPAHAAALTQLQNLRLTADGNLQASVSQPTKATVFYRTLGHRYQVIWDLENTQLSSTLASTTNLTSALKTQWPTLVSASLQNFTGPVVRIRLEWDLSENKAFTGDEPIIIGHEGRQPLLQLSPLLTNAASATHPTTVAVSYPAIATPSVNSSTVPTSKGRDVASLKEDILRERITLLENDLRTWQAKVDQEKADKEAVTSRLISKLSETEKQLANATAASTIPKQPASDYTKLHEALESSKAALAKAISTINKQNESIQGLKSQVAELRNGLDSSTLDQQTFLNEELNKAEQTQKTLKQQLADTQREADALKLVVDSLKKQQADLQEQLKAATTLEPLTAKDGWKKSGS